MAESKSHALEIASGARFEFGKNWQQFLSVLDEARILEAEQSLTHMLETESLAGKSFLPLGVSAQRFIHLISIRNLLPVQRRLSGGTSRRMELGGLRKDPF